MLAFSRAALKGVARGARRQPEPPVASLHTTSSLRVPHGLNPHFSTSNAVHSAKHLVTRILSHIVTVPARTNAPITHVLTRGLSTTPTTMAVRPSLPLRSRVGTSRPFGAPFMPRSPILVNRSVSQVGLGTARNFSSGRPVFQNLVQNVPVAGRAFFEVDLDIKMRTENTKRRYLSNKTKPLQSRRMEMLKSNAPSTTGFLSAPLSALSSDDIESSDANYSHFFARPPTEPSITTLSIPLSPAGNRVPLEPSPVISTRDLVFSIHDTYSDHSIRVASLFRRLDQADIWNRGATCDCIDATGEGLPRMLRVRLDGWTERMLRDVIGEAGKGWCEITSVRKVLPVNARPACLSSESVSFMMPTLDFSASFPLDGNAFMSSRTSSAHEAVDDDHGSYGYISSAGDSWPGTDSEFETGMEGESGSDGWDESSGSGPPSGVRRIVFSSSFVDRIN